MSAARVRRPGMIQVHGVTTHSDVIWQIGNGPKRETSPEDVINGRGLFRHYTSGLVGLRGEGSVEYVNESDLIALHDALKARNRGEGHPLCLSCHRQSVVLGLDVCSGCNDGAELRPDMDADRYVLGEWNPNELMHTVDCDCSACDDASHTEEQRRMGARP